MNADTEPGNAEQGHAAPPSEGHSILLVVTSPITVAAFLGPLVRGLCEQGWRVVVAAGAGVELDEFGQREHVETVPLGMVRDPSVARDFASLRELSRVIRRVNPVGVIAATPKASLLAMVAAWAAGVPIRIHLGWGMRSETLRGWKRTALRVMEAAPVWASTATVANSASLADEMRRLPLVRDRRVVTLGAGSSHGVDLTRFHPRPRKAQSGTPPTVGFVGRLNRDKGVDTLLDAVELLAHRGVGVRLELYGAAEDDGLLKRIQHAESDGGHVVYRGSIAPVDIYPHLDVLCLPSLREGFPNVVLEAAASGIPTVATTATGVRDSVLDGVTGVLVAPGDVPQLADALGRLIQDNQTRSAMGKAARAWAIENFDEADVVGAFVGFWNNVADEKTTQRISRVHR